MQKVLLTINNQQNTQVLLRLIENLDFIELVEITTLVSISQKISNKEEKITKCSFKTWEEFENGLGLWKDRIVTKEDLRNKAWRSI